MNNTQYLEKRLALLNGLCTDYAKGETSAMANYHTNVVALDDSVDDTLAFIRLAKDFSLSEFEKNVLFMALAPVIDAGFKQKIIDIM